LPRKGSVSRIRNEQLLLNAHTATPFSAHCLVLDQMKNSLVSADTPASGDKERILQLTSEAFVPRVLKSRAVVLFSSAPLLSRSESGQLPSALRGVGMELVPVELWAASATAVQVRSTHYSFGMHGW